MSECNCSQCKIVSPFIRSFMLQRERRILEIDEKGAQNSKDTPKLPENGEKG